MIDKTNNAYVTAQEVNGENYVKSLSVNGTAITITNNAAEITLQGALPIVTSSDNGKVLKVVNGQWTLATPTAIYTGSAAPDSSTGNNGDIYLQT